jgi:hypothetical protein
LVLIGPKKVRQKNLKKNQYFKRKKKRKKNNDNQYFNNVYIVIIHLDMSVPNYLTSSLLFLEGNIKYYIMREKNLYFRNIVNINVL